MVLLILYEEVKLLLEGYVIIQLHVKSIRPWSLSILRRGFAWRLAQILSRARETRREPVSEAANVVRDRFHSVYGAASLVIVAISAFTKERVAAREDENITDLEQHCNHCASQLEYTLEYSAPRYSSTWAIFGLISALRLRERLRANGTCLSSFVCSKNHCGRAFVVTVQCACT